MIAGRCGALVAASQTWFHGDGAAAAARLPVVVAAVLAGMIVTDSLTQAWTIMRELRGEFLVARTGAPPTPRARFDVKPVTAAHLFGVSGGGANAGETAPEVSIASLHLNGTIAVEGAPEKGFAMLGGADSVQHLVAAGGQVDPARILVGVYTDHVVLSHLGAYETLSLPKRPAVTATKYVAVVPHVEPATIESQVEQAAGQYSRILSVPQNDSGRFNGVTFTADVDASGLGALGLHAGDRLLTINGVRVTSPETLAELSTGTQVALGVEGEGGYHVVHVDSSRLR